MLGKNPANPIIVALDGMDVSKTMSMAQQLSGKVGGLKVNSVMKDPGGPGTGIIGLLKQYGPVVADAKEADIPSTDVNDVMEFLKTSPDALTIKADIAMDAMLDIVAARGPIDILAVTVLTSMFEEEAFLTFGAPVKAKVLYFARMAKLAGVQGIVCSAADLKFGLPNRRELHGLVWACPGIRPAWSQKPDDQKREMTPGEAIKLGADYLIIGRPITQAKKYGAESADDAIKRTLEEIEAARADMAMTAKK